MLRLRLLLAMYLPAAILPAALVSSVFAAAFADALCTDAFAAGRFDPAGLAVLATAVLAVGLVSAVVHTAQAADPAPAVARRTGLRARAELSAFLRLRDPDAAGRPRPRAPGVAPAIAG